MENKNIIIEKRVRKANSKYNTNDYESLTAAQKRAITRELKQDNKADKQSAYKERVGEAKIKDIVNKRKVTKDLNMKVLDSFKIFKQDIKLNNVVNIFKKFNNKTINKLPVQIKGHNVLQIKINKNLMDRATIEKLSQDVSNEMNKLNINGTIYTTLKYNEHKYRSGNASRFGQKIQLFRAITYNFEEEEDDDQEYFNCFSMYLIEGNKPEGGATNDDNNNCFYECIKKF